MSGKAVPVWTWHVLIALFTIILAIATILLWVVAHGILTDSCHTTEKQLRVALEFPSFMQHS